MTLLPRLFFYGYVAMLLGVGVSGLFIADWELRTVFAVDLTQLTEGARATLLNQYRFLKAMEFGFGLFSFVFRREIFGVDLFHRLFLVILFTGAAARTLSMGLDGRPGTIFILFTILEVVTGVLVLLNGRTLLKHYDRDATLRQPA